MKREISERTANGERIADIFLEMLEDNDREETKAFVNRLVHISGINSRRRLCKIIMSVSKNISDTKIITAQNDDVVNFYRHLSLVCGGLPLRD